MIIVKLASLSVQSAYSLYDGPVGVIFPLSSFRVSFVYKAVTLAFGGFPFYPSFYKKKTFGEIIQEHDHMLFRYSTVLVPNHLNLPLHSYYTDGHLHA